MSETTELIAQQILNGNINKRTWGTIIYNVKVYGAFGDGVNDDTNEIASVITAAEIAGGIVAFPPGTYNTGNLTTPSNVTLWFANGAKLSVNSGTTVTINGPVEAGLHQIFSGSGSVVGAVKNTFIYPQWFGAKGDGVTDDGAAIIKAMAMATSCEGTLCFPASSGNYRTSLTLNITPSFSIFSAGGTVESTGSVTDAFVFADGNYVDKVYKLPSIVNFINGCGIRLLGADLVYAEAPNIANCKSGVKIETDSTRPNCLDNTIIANTINACTNSAGGAIHFKATTNAEVIQGNVITVNFVTGNAIGVYFDKPNGIEPAWDDNLIQPYALEGEGGPNSRGIYAPFGMPGGRTTINCTTFFGGFVSDYVNAPGNNNTFNLAFVEPVAYSKINVTGVGNIVRNVGGNYERSLSNPSQIAAQGTTNSRASFNSGSAVMANKFQCLLNVSALTVGQTQSFYVYHPFTTGYSNMVTCTPHFSKTLAIMAIEDVSVLTGTIGTTSPNEIHIRVVALATVTTGYQSITVEVGL